MFDELNVNQSVNTTVEPSQDIPQKTKEELAQDEKLRLFKIRVARAQHQNRIRP